MPPKSKTSAKRASPRKKKATPSEAPSPLPAVAEESTEISTAAIAKDEAPPEENEIAPMASLNEEKAVEVTEEAMEEKTAEVTAGSEKIEEEIVVEKIAEETTVEKIEKEVVVEETVTVKAPMEGDAGNVVVPEISGEAEDEENEAEDEENEAEDEEGEESEEEESEEEEEEEEEEKEEAGMFFEFVIVLNVGLFLFSLITGCFLVAYILVRMTGVKTFFSRDPLITNPSCKPSMKT